jgi:hypothetical protein
MAIDARGAESFLTGEKAVPDAVDSGPDACSHRPVRLVGIASSS